jgi:protease I
MDKPLAGKRVAILVAHEYEDIELLYSVLQLSEMGAKVTVATLPLNAKGHFHTRPSFPEKPVTGRFGHPVPMVVLAEGVRYTTASIYDLHVNDFDGLVIPGGYAPDFLRTDRRTLSFIAEMYRQGKVVAAICHGPIVFISVDKVMGTDIVRGRKVAAVDACADDLMNAGGLWEDVPCFRVGNVVTGRIPDDLPPFIHEVTNALVEMNEKIPA